MVKGVERVKRHIHNRTGSESLKWSNRVIDIGHHLSGSEIPSGRRWSEVSLAEER